MKKVMELVNPSFSSTVGFLHVSKIISENILAQSVNGQKQSLNKTFP